VASRGLAGRDADCPAGYFGLVGLAGGVQLAPGPVGERLDDHRLQQVAGGAQLRVEAAKLAGGQPRLGRRGGCEECRCCLL
jgi:hypothetical protein